MERPDFVIAGAPKCGSFLLFEELKKHTGINMSLRKEPHIYSENWGKNAVGPFWANGKAGQLKGEATVGYFLDPQVPFRIFDTHPESRVIFCLRNPIERTYSHYWHAVKNSYELRKWNDALKSRNNQDQYLFENSFYYRNISRFLEFFPRQQVHVFFLEGYIKNPLREMTRVIEFLKLPMKIEPVGSSWVNRGKAYRHKNLHRALERVRKDHLSIPRIIRKPGKHIYQLLVDVNTRRVDHKLLRAEDRDILREMYQTDVRFLREAFSEVGNHWTDFGNGT